MAGSGNNVHLLLSCKVDKFNCITGNTDCKVCVLFFFRVFHSVDQLLFSKYVYVQVMSALIKVSVKYVNKVVCTFFIIVSQSIRIDSLSIGNTVKSIFIVKLCNRVQRSKKSVLLCSVGRVSARSQRLACFSSVRKRSCSFTINNIGCNGKDGCGRFGITVGR